MIPDSIEDLTPIQQRAAQILQPLMLAYPSAKITPQSIAIYAIALSEITEAELTAGVLRCMRTCKFFPSIAEIMEAAQTVVEVAKGTREKSPDEAWNEVQRQMEEAFVYKKPVFSTTEIEKAALSMGWIGLCNTPTDQIGTARAQFLKLYASVLGRSKDTRINDRVIEIMGGARAIKQLAGDVANKLIGA